MDDFDFNIDNIQPDTIVVLGIPLDENSSFLRGPALAPLHIQESFYSASSNLWTENQIDLGANQSWQFVGDLDLLESEFAFTKIELAT